MTQPSPQPSVPGPPRPAPAPGSPSAVAVPPAGPDTPVPAAEQAASTPDRFVDLGQHPVAEHVAVFEAEHGRLQRELGTIDQL